MVVLPRDRATALRCLAVDALISSSLYPGQADHRGHASMRGSLMHFQFLFRDP